MTTQADKPKIPLWKILLPIMVILGVVIAALQVIKGQVKPPVNTHTDENGVESTVEVDTGQTLPDFALTEFGKGPRKLSELPAKVYMINFWATWCESCVVEMPSIVKLRETYHAKGFELILVNLDEDPAAVLPKALAKFGIKFPVYTDPESQVADLLNIYAIPFTLILDANRKVLLIESGEREWFSPEFRGQLEKWLNP